MKVQAWNFFFGGGICKGSRGKIRLQAGIDEFGVVFVEVDVRSQSYRVKS